MAELSDVILIGTVAQQPAATTVAPGTLYCQTDGSPANNLQRSNGTTWEDYAPGSGGGGGAIGLEAGTQSVSTGTVVFSNSNGVSFGMSNSSVVTATVRTNYAGTVTAITGGSITVNTSGVSLNLPAYLTTAALSQDSSKYAGTAGAITGGSITVNTSGVSVNLPAYLTTAMASNRGSDFVQATAVFHGTNASGTIASNAISISVATAAGGNVNFSAGTTSSGLDSVVFSNSNGVSFGLNGSTITATVKTDYQSSGNYLTTAMASNRGTDFVQATAGFFGTNASGTIASDGISVSVAAPSAASINFSAGTTSNNLTQVSFKDTNGVSFGLNAGTITATVKTDYQTSGNYLTTAMASNRGSDFVQATAAFAGTNASGTINSTGISVSVGNYITTADLSQNSSKYVQAWELTGNTAGTTSSLQGTKLYFEGGNSITVSGNSNTVKFSVGNYITTADLSQNSSKYVQNWKLTGNTAGTTSSAQGTDLWFSGGNSITVSGNSNTIVFSVGNYLTTARASTDAIGLNTAKTNVTWTVNSSGLSLDAGGYAGTGFTTATTAGTAIVGTHNTAGLSMGVPAYLTTAALSGDTTKYAQAWDLTGNTAGTTSSLQGTIWHLSGGANVTLSGNSNTIVISAASAAAAPVNFSAGTTSGNLGSVVFSNSNGISFGLNGSTITGTVSTYSTVGTATSGYDVASANSIGTITRWAAEDHRHAGIGAIGISTGNTTGTSGSVQGTYWFVGGSNQTISQITSNNGSHTLQIVGKNEGYIPFLEPYPLTNTATFAPGAGTWYLAPFTAFGSMSGGRINVLANNTATANLFLDIGETAYNSSKTGGYQQSYTHSAAVALFSQGTGANSSLLQSFWSNSYSMGWSKSLSISTNAATNIAVSLAHSVSYISDIGSDGAYTNVQLAGAGSSTIANSSGASTLVSTVFSSGRNLFSGSLVQPFGFNTTISAGVYWLGYAWSSTRASASTGGQLSSGSDFSFGALQGISRLEQNSVYRNFGSTATAARTAQVPYGLYTAAANMVPPTNIAISSDLSSLASQWVPYFNFQVRGLTK